MTTLGNIQMDSLGVGVMSVLLAFVLNILYCTVKSSDINFKVLVISMTIVTIVMVSAQKYYYSNEQNKILNRFNSGGDLICKFNKNSNIVISKKRGYKLKSRFFLKDGMAIKMGSCYLLE